MAQLFTAQQLPTTSEQAIRQFDERYLAAITAAAPPDWCSSFVFPTDAPRTTFPMALMSQRYRETKEVSSRFRTMVEQSFDLNVVEYDDGYNAPLLEILTNAFRYRNWSRAPQALVDGEQKHVAKQLVKLLEDTAQLSPWDGLAFFHASHKSNPKEAIPATEGRQATFSNLQATPADAADLTKIQAEMTAMRDVRDENGDKMGIEPTEIWLPTSKFQAVSDKLNQALINGGETNPLKGKITPVHISDLTDVNDWYLVDRAAFSRGIEPMIAPNFRPVGDLGLRQWDTSSDYFKETGHIKMSAHIWYGFKLVFPHAIRKVVGV
jgi:hypothetical protein